MNPEFKAEELIQMFIPYSYFGVHRAQAIDCALVCVRQIIKHRPTHPMNWDEHGEPINQVDWWKMVEQILLKKKS